MQVSTSRTGAVARVEFSHPPVNALSSAAGLVQALSAALAALDHDPDVQAIVLRGEGRGFSAGADIADFRDDPELDVGPLRRLIEAVDAMRTPVVAAIHGMALGGGLELALAAHARVCAAGARLAFPEVTLGLLPGAGGTQRLPRLCGPALALDLMLDGKPIDAAAALAAGIVDAVVEAADLEAAASARALSLAGGAALPRARDRAAPAVAAAEAVAAARARAGRGAGTAAARAAIADCVEASVLPFEQGLALEHARFDALMLSEPARGLRHAFLAERAVGKIPGLPATAKARPIASVAIVGAGTMGSGIAVAALNAELPVVLIEQRPEALARGTATVRSLIQAAVDKGRVSQAAADTRLARLTPSLQIDDCAEADLVIEAVFEELEAKRQVFQAVDRAAKPGAILASNTSTLDLDAIAAFTTRPEAVLGLHFFSPAHVMKLLEVVRGRATDPEVLATGLGFARSLGKVGVVAGVCDGFIGNRLFEEYLRQAYFLLEDGVAPHRIDGALERWGMAMGPLRTMDLVGQDIGWSIRKRRAIEQPDRPYSPLPDQLCEQGRLGQKTGAGWYLYPEGSRTAVNDPAVEAMVSARAETLGAPRREIGDDEIVDRCILALVNEGARVVEEGVAYRPLDVDVIYLNGYGFPRERGGPMFQADRRGLTEVLSRIRAFAAGRQGWAWTPAPLLVALADRGGDFASLNR